MNERKVIVLCGSRFALPALQELAFFNQLALVVIPRHCPEMIEDVKALLNGTSIPVLVVDKASCTEQITAAIKQYQPNIGLVLSFSYKIPESVYTLPPAGFFNVHPGPLPQYRGADPVFRQLKNKEKTASVTIHQLDNGFDTGPVVMEERIRIEPGDSYGLLTTKLSHTATNLVRTLLKLTAFQLTIPSRPQNEAMAGYFSKQGAGDITIDWQHMDAETIIALINACNPWNKGAVTKLNEKIIRLVEAEITHQKGLTQEPGTIVGFEDPAFLVAVLGGQAIRVRIVYLEEGFFSGARLQEFGVMAGHRFSAIQ